MKLDIIFVTVLGELRFEEVYFYHCHASVENDFVAILSVTVGWIEGGLA